MSTETTIPAAGVRDVIADTIRELVRQGKIRPGDRDTDVMHQVGEHIGARGANPPSERSFRRHLPGLRVMWRTAK
jgi:hypothetical protein